MKFFQWLSDTVFKLEKLVSIILMIVMLTSLSAGVIFRYFFSNPLSWSEELAIYTLIWITFIGGSMSIRTEQAASLAIVFEKLKISSQKVILIIGFLFITAFSVFVGYLSLNWISSPSVSMQIAPSLGITMFYPYLAIPIGFLCMGIHSLNHFVQSFTYGKNKNEQ